MFIRAQMERSKDILLFAIGSIKIGKRSYSKDRISVTFDSSTEGGSDFSELANWSSALSKERDLEDKEIDARYSMGTTFTNDDLNLELMWSKIGEVANRYWTILLNEDKTFEMDKTGYEEKARGTYNTTRTYLYLTFEEDELFNSVGKTIPFRMS